MDTIKTTWAYKDGVRACNAGESRDSNPCDPMLESERAVHWTAGWNDAAPSILPSLKRAALNLPIADQLSLIEALCDGDLSGYGSFGQVRRACDLTRIDLAIEDEQSELGRPLTEAENDVAIVRAVEGRMHPLFEDIFAGFRPAMAVRS